MNRRGFLASAGALAFAGCTGRIASEAAEEPTNATVTEKTTNAIQPTATPSPSDGRSLATFTPQSDTRTETWAEGAEGPPQPALTVRYAGPMDDEERRVTVTIADDDGTVVFERVGTLAPGESVAFEEPIGESGTYRLHVRLENGISATEELTVPDGGIPDYVSYAVDILGGDVEIGRMEV